MKKINLIEMLQGCSKRNGTAVYASNPDGQPTVNRRSRLTSYPGEMNEKEQMSSTCPRFALVLPSFCSRLDSLSLVSRQSDLDQVRAVSVGLSARVWKHVAMIFAVLTLSIANIGMAWGDVLWQSDMQESISGVTITKLNNSDTWATGLNLAWAPGLPKAYQPSGSNRGVQLAFDTPLSLQSGDIIRVFAGGTNNTERTLSLFLNDGGSAVGTVSLPNGTLRVLDYPISSATTLNKIKITSSANAVYIFKVIIFRNVPATGTTTITYEMRYKNKDVQGRTDNCISTVTGLSSAFTLNGLTTSTSNGVVSFCGEITGHPTSEDNTKNVDLQFTIANGYTFTPSSVSFKWDGNNSTVKAKVTITDGTTTVTSNESTASGSPSVSNAKSFSFASGAFDGKTFTGTVHIKVHIWSSATGKRAFILSPFSLTGTVASAAPVTTHSVSAVTSTGTNTYGTVSAAASTVAESGTTTITAAPAEGYRVTNWAVSGTGASISPSGASNSETTTLTMGTADATVTVTFGAIPTHTITYTNTKGMDNSANPTSYYEGVGVASFTKLRHAEGYDFTGWSPSSISSSATTNQTIDAQWSANAVATGTGTLIYNFGYSDNTITTSSITRNNGALYDATDLTWTGVTIDNSESAERSGKITTTSSYDSDKYLTLTFKIADGYTFTPTEVQLKAVAVSQDKTIRFEFTDNAGTPNTKHLEQTRTNGSSVGTLTYDFDASDPVTLTGTVTVKIYAYGNTDSWRLGTPLTITGTVASAASDAYGIYIGKNNDNYTLENLTNTSGTTWSKTITLDAGSYYEFKVKKTPSAGAAVWYGNNGKITATTSPAWDFNTSDGNCKLYTTVAGSYTFSWDASTNKLTITYPAGDHPTKRVYMVCGSGTWCDATPKFFVHSWGVTDYNTQVQQNACGEYYADIIWYNDYFQFTRNNSTATAYDDQNWNYSQNLTYNSSQLLWTFSGWDGSTGNFSSSTYSPTTYTISYNAGTGGSGSKASESKTCGVDFTLPNSAVFTRTGYTQTGWTTSDGGSQTHALGGSYTTNAAQAFYPVWTPNNYTITLNGNGGTGNTSSVTATYNSATLSSSITNPTKDCYTFDGWFSGEGGTGTLIINTSGVLQASTTYTGAGGIWTNDGNVTLYAKWTKTPTALTLVLDGDAATPAGGSPIGTEYTLTCSASTGAIASYQWKQNTTASTTGAVDAEGTGATTASFSPVPAAAGTYYYYCVATDACDNSVNTSYSGAFTFTAPADPCSEPAEVTNEIARFFVPCGLSNAISVEPSAWTVTNQDASTGDNTFTTSSFGGGSSNWYRNETSGLIYGKLSGNSSYILLKLKSGSFQAGDVVTAYFNRNDANKSGLTLKTQGSSYAITPAATAAGVETSGTYTLVADAIEADGSIKLFRANSSSYVNRIIVTRPAAVPTITATKTSPDYVSPDPNNVVLSISTTGASAGWYYRVKNTGTAGYQTPDNTPYNTATWTMTSGLALGANNFVVELYNGSGVKQAESGTITVTAETAYPITIAAGAGGSVSPSGEIKANESGNHIHPAITATPNSGYHFVNWTYSNSNATVADASSASTTVNDARGACTITANFEADAPVASQTALVINTLYEVPDMIPSGESLTSSDQFMAGLSENTKFEMIGVPASSSTPKVNNDSKNDKTIDGITFDDGSMWFKGNANLTSNIPTTFGLSFIVPEGGGKLYLYFSGTSTNIKLAKSGASGSKPSCASGYGEVDVTAGTYYLYGTGTTAPYCFYGLKLCSTYGVTITPTNVTKETGDTGAGAAIHGKAYTATFTANTGYTLPSDVTVSIGGVAQTKGTGYTWTVSSGTGTLTVPAVKVTGNIVVTVTGTAAATYALTYNCNGAESGCPSNTTASALPNPLPSAPTKDGYTFGGWYTNEELTVSAVAGAAMTGATTLYAKWTVNSSSECITITNFATSNVNNTCGDGNGKIFYGYKGSVSDANALTITSNDGNDRGQNSGAEMRLTYNKLMRIYANNTTNAAPATFSNVTSVSFKWKFIASGNSGNTELTSSYTVKVGSTTIANAVSITGKTKDGYQTVTIDNLAQLSGYVEIKFGGSSSSYNVYLDDIEICTADMSACTTPVIPSLSNQALCEGANAAAWDATVTNAAAISAAGETVSYQWQLKNGSNWDDISGATSASYDVSDAVTEAMAGTYRVVVTVSKAGYSSSSATREVTLSVTEATEVTGITADKATVYLGNSVTLTATANTTVTWQWYTCTNAEGAGAAIISGAESASYTITSAGAGVAGTYYYKAVATGSCGTAERVYTLVVSEAAGGDCETEIWVVKAADLPEGATAATHITTPFTGGSNESASITIDGNTYTITQRTSNATGPATIVVPEGNTATLYILVKGNNGRSVILEKGGVEQWTETPEDGWQALSVDNLAAGTYSLRSSNNLGWGLLALKLCSASACSDPEVTASADNTTACVGTSVTFTADHAHASATYQWQKLDGTWTNISGATASTYNIASVVAGDAGKYRVIASHDCNRTSNEVTLSVPSAPNFGSTVPASVSVMQTIALSINTVEATDAVKYRWYKSADATWDAGDVEIGTNKELIKAYDSEAIGSPSYYIFCRAQNACGITTSTAIEVNVTAYVEEDCAARGNESDAAFSFENSGCGQGSYESTACWTMNSNSKILVYYPPTGKYFKTAKVTIASSSASKASYNWSTNGGTTFTEAAINSINTTLTEKTFDLSAHGHVNALQIGRNLDGKGESSGTLYVSKICFEYTDACTATTVTPDESSKTYEMGSGSFTEPTFTVKHGGTAFDPQPTLTYSSSNEDIASVDDDGAVTFNGDAGTVTITASYAGGTISATDYCASSGSYTITVSCPGGAPKIVPASSVDLSGCNSSVVLNAKEQDGTTDFTGGSYQWLRNGEEIDGATNKSYTATQAGIYTVEYTSAGGCTSVSTNSAVVTSETTEPEVERLVPFQYYHVDKTYSNQMKMRHLFAVKNSGKLDGKSFKMYVSRNGGAATDVTSSNALVVWPNGDGHVDTVMVNLNELSGKYSENDELVYTCKAIDCSGNVSEVYKNTITMRVIGATPTLALICSGSSKAEGTRKTGELTVGGDFLTGYNVADLCQQTGNTSFDGNTEWGLYTDLKTQYIVTPVNGYAVFNKLNYEPFDILLLTDYPKASKSDAAKDVLDDMAALCDYRPMLSFKTHMVAKSPSKWAEKGFTTSPVVSKADGRLNLNIVCYAHPMFEGLKSGEDVYEDVNNTSAPLVYTMLTGEGYESKKGMQGFELAAAENFVTIGLTHYNANITKDSPETGDVSWTPGSEDRMLVTVAERQTNIEARFILFSLNCGAQSKLTERGEQVILACLEYLLDDDPLHVADCSFTFDNGASNEHDAAWYSEHCNTCTGTKGDGKWTTAANWGPDYRLLPGEFTSVRIKAPVEVNDEHAHVMEVRIIDEGSINIPAGKALDVKSTIRRMDGTEIYPTEIGDIHIGSASTGNGTLIFNNDDGDTKARVDMYSTAKTAEPDPETGVISAAASTWQYIGTPHSDVVNARYNYYNSWLYQYSGSGWEVIPNGGPLVPFRGYCVTHPDAPVVFGMEGTLVATTAQSIAIPAGYTVIANSWVAPIDISTFTDDDMENISDKTIYFFNTGTDADGNHGTGTEAGTYVAVPKNSASYVGTWQIPSMQGFYISTSSAGTLHLDYDRHVRPSTDRSILSGRMYAPRRAAAESDEPNVLKIFARGSRYQDKLVVLEREDFTRGYDSGWDGEAWGGGTLSPMVYVTGDGREDAVSAIPEFEGTVVAFKAGEDSEYRFEFNYSEDAEPLYLFDTENNTYTQIMTGNAYYFTTADKAPHSRFILTRQAPQVTTGCEYLNGSEGAKAKKLIIEDKMYIMLNGALYDATGKAVK